MTDLLLIFGYLLGIIITGAIAEWLDTDLHSLVILWPFMVLGAVVVGIPLGLSYLGKSAVRAFRRPSSAGRP